jgi:hypothetical protein
VREDGVQSVSKCERDKMEVIPSFYTDREGRRGSRKGPAVAHLPLMAGGPCGSEEGKKGNERKLEERVGAGVNCLSMALKEGREAGKVRGRVAAVTVGARLKHRKGAREGRMYRQVGPACQRPRGKEERGRERWAAGEIWAGRRGGSAGEKKGSWAGGLKGRGEGLRLSFFLFFNLFKLKHFKLFSKFSKNI